MRSMATIGAVPAGRPLPADSILEMHAARLLLLLRLAGRKNKVDGLTKLAKLDFFVRYPQFFERVSSIDSSGELRSGDAGMVRHHYGPWDPRYYDVLSYLESRGLLRVTRKQGAFSFLLTDIGVEVADTLSSSEVFMPQAEQIRAVGKAFGTKSGSWLKNHIYSEFAAEIEDLPLGSEIS